MAENNFSLQKTLTMLLDEKKYHSLRDILSTMNPADIAAIFDDLDQPCLPLLFMMVWFLYWKQKRCHTEAMKRCF